MCVAMIFSASPAKAVQVNQVIKSQGGDTVYWLGPDLRRYPFPNAGTFFSWYPDFSNVVIVTDQELQNIQLGTENVTYRPKDFSKGRLVKISTDPKVYAVEAGAKLRHIATEQLARELFGSNWAMLIDDIPVEFFANYEIAEPITTLDDFFDLWLAGTNVLLPHDSFRDRHKIWVTQLSIGSSRYSVLPGDKLILDTGWNNNRQLTDIVEIQNASTGEVLQRCEFRLRCQVVVYPAQTNDGFVQYLAVAKSESGNVIFSKLFDPIRLDGLKRMPGSMTLRESKAQVRAGERIEVTSILSGLEIPPVAVEINYYDERDDRWIGGCRTPGFQCTAWDFVQLDAGEARPFRYYAVAKHYQFTDGRELPVAYTGYITIVNE